MGVKMTSGLIGFLKEKINSGESLDKDEFIGTVKGRLISIFTKDGITGGPVNISKIKNLSSKGEPAVIMLVGVNGVGKTTTAAKLASKFKNEGYKVILAAADTFRAAAVEQLRSWGDKINVPVVYGAQDAKPATVVYDAAMRAKNETADVLIIDTAGRLHTKSNLMQELTGVKNSAARHIENAPHETFLVVDGSTGQNALSQAEEFNQATKLSGLIVTKLDGSSKGGIVSAITDELGIPVRYIGVGESEDDLRPFTPHEFVDALLDESDDGEADTYTLAAGNLSAHSQVRRRRREN